MGLITKASNGNGVAAAARVNNIRAVGNNVISVDNTGNFPGIGVGGALSGEKFHFATWAVDGSDKYVVESMMEMVGHLSSIGEITIDSFDPGYEDKGNNNGDVVRIKPTTGWENDLVDALKQSLKNDGTLKENIVGDDQLKTDSAFSKILSDLGGYIVSGAEVTRTSGSSYAMSAGEIILNGKKIAVDAIQSRTFTDKKDVAIDINTEGDISYVEADRDKLPAVEGGKFRLWSAAIDTANSSGFIWSNKGQSKVVGKDNIDFTTLAFGNYSTTEVDTGFKWIDGKAIHKKTVNFGALPSSTTKAVAHGASVKKIINYEVVSDDGVNAIFPIPFIRSNGGTDNAELRLSPTNITITTNTANWVTQNAYVTIYYTKV